MFLCLSTSLGKRLASPIKPGPRAKRAKGRSEKRSVKRMFDSATPSTSRSITPVPIPQPSYSTVPPIIAAAGEQLHTDYQIHELPGENESSDSSSTVLVNRALLARIEMLESENLRLREGDSRERKYFRIEAIQHNDKFVSLYTGFVSFVVLSSFFEFLGPVTGHLNYWGSKEGSRVRKRKHKLNPKNQFFLTMVKLKLNLTLADLAYRFGISTSVASRYITTWVCFLYHQLKEIDWMPTVEQVKGTLPIVFRQKFPSTYAIIDGSEVFIETPSDLHMQSSTWSQYKHHNTVKFLVACTPNGAICFISPVYVGSISDKELTCNSGFLTTLQDKPGISIMADRGFTIKDVLSKLNIGLNIPPFLEKRKQLPPEDIEVGRKIASLRIHVERAIGRIKNFHILKSTIPINMIRLTNQIVYVCAFLTNFQPALVPSTNDDDNTVESYFEQLSEDQSSDFDSEESD